jgi:hypothetical protein
VWAEAAKWVAKFPEGVVTAVDGQGYPVSARQTSLPYDAAAGSLPVTVPESLGALPGPASLLCHKHDEQLWGIEMILLRGRLEERESGLVFVTESFTPPSALALIRNMRRSARRYLDRRNLPRPKVDFGVIDQLWGKVPPR